MTTAPKPLFDKKPRRLPARGAKATAGVQRSLKLLRERGYHADVCERWVANPVGKAQASKFTGGYRRDLFGVADIVAFHPSLPEVLLVQVTTRDQIGPHVRAYRTDRAIAALLNDWLRQSNRQFVIHGWYAVERATKSGGKVVRWRCEEQEIIAGDL